MSAHTYSPRAILIIRLSSMGDVLLSTALIRQLRASYPHARIDVVTDQRFTDCYRHNPHISTLYTLSANERLPHQYSAQTYDVIIDLQKNLRSRALVKNTHATVYRIDKSRLKKLALVYAKINLYTSIEHITERYRRAALALPLVADEQEMDLQGLELWLPEEQALSVYPPAQKKHSLAEPLIIALAPSAHHATKRWLPERFAELAVVLSARYNAEIALVGGTQDIERCNGIEAMIHARAGNTVRVRNHAGAESLFETARLLDMVSLLVTNDTGVMHIASARQIPIVALFGSTVQEFGFTPYRVPHQIVEIPASQLSCRPCTHIGRAECPKKHFRCMRDIHVQDVMNATDSLWGNVYR